MSDAAVEHKSINGNSCTCRGCRRLLYSSFAHREKKMDLVSSVSPLRLDRGQLTKPRSVLPFTDMNIQQSSSPLLDM